VTGICKLNKYSDVIDSKQLFKFTSQRCKHSLSLSTTSFIITIIMTFIIISLTVVTIISNSRITTS